MSGIRLGLHAKMPSDEYHAIQAMNASGLRLMAKSPAHYYGSMLDPHRPPESQTAATRNGTLFHCALFEPDSVSDRYVTAPALLNMRTKEGREWSKEQTREIVDEEDIARAMRQANSVRALPDVSDLMRDGIAEVSAFWNDATTGVLCKCRPDFVASVGKGDVILIDGKSTRDASPNGFAKTIWNFRYDLQAAWYSAGWEAATEQRVIGFVFAAVENEWPHQAAAYMLGDDVLEAAQRTNQRLLQQYAECWKTGVWQGYPTGVQLVNLPKWAKLEEE